MSKNVTEVLVTDKIVLYSYGVPVAAFVPGHGYVKTARKYSVTTSKHANQFIRAAGVPICEVPDDVFRKLIAE